MPSLLSAVFFFLYEWEIDPLVFLSEFVVGSNCFNATTLFILHSNSFIHSFTHSLIHSFTHSLIQSLNHSLIHSFNHSIIHSLIHSFTHSIIHSLIIHRRKTGIHFYYIMAISTSPLSTTTTSTFVILARETSYGLVFLDTRISPSPSH